MNIEICKKMCKVGKVEVTHCGYKKALQLKMVFSEWRKDASCKWFTVDYDSLPKSVLKNFNGYQSFIYPSNGKVLEDVDAPKKCPYQLEHLVS